MQLSACQPSIPLLSPACLGTALPSCCLQVIDALRHCQGGVREALEHVLAVRRMCAAVRASLETHIRAEESELWPLFTEHFTTEEQQYLVRGGRVTYEAGGFSCSRSPAPGWHCMPVFAVVQGCLWAAMTSSHVHGACLCRWASLLVALVPRCCRRCCPGSLVSSGAAAWPDMASAAASVWWELGMPHFHLMSLTVFGLLTACRLVLA